MTKKVPLKLRIFETLFVNNNLNTFPTLEVINLPVKLPYVIKMYSLTRLLIAAKMYSKKSRCTIAL